MPYAITVIHPDGTTGHIVDVSTGGPLTFPSRDDADRHIWRLSYCNTGHLYEVAELPE